jgi:hypothetical protein
MDWDWVFGNIKPEKLTYRKFLNALFGENRNCDDDYESYIDGITYKYEVDEYFFRDSIEPVFTLLKDHPKISLWKTKFAEEFSKTIANFFSAFPEWVLTEDFCRAAARMPYNLKLIPDEYFNVEIVKISFENKYWRPDYLKGIKEELITQEIANLVFEKNHLSYNYIPENKRTEEMTRIFKEKSA